MKNQELKQPTLEQVQVAFHNAGNSPEIQTLLRDLYGDAVEPEQEAMRPVEERIKTVRDAMEELGDDHPFVIQYAKICTNHFDDDNPHDSADIIAYLKLRIICAALNEGWEPQFTEDEYRWYPWFILYSAEELAKKTEEWKANHIIVPLNDSRVVGRSNNNAYAYGGLVYAGAYSVSTYSSASSGSRLAFKTEALAKYAARQFATLWADFYIGRKEDDNE